MLGIQLAKRASYSIYRQNCDKEKTATLYSMCKNVFVEEAYPV
jgi:hypothetical protein